jgi:hypothetical protein
MPPRRDDVDRHLPLKPVAFHVRHSLAEGERQGCGITMDVAGRRPISTATGDAAIALPPSGDGAPRRFARVDAVIAEAKAKQCARTAA